jgi:3-methylcrotonyl-CoA carboxylase beta subunit
MQGMIAEMDELRTKAREGGGKEVLERWKSRGKGKMGARERCVDERSWELMGAG